MDKCFTIEDGVKAALKVYECTPKQKWEFIPAKEGELFDIFIVKNLHFHTKNIDTSFEKTQK